MCLQTFSHPLLCDVHMQSGKVPTGYFQRRPLRSATHEEPLKNHRSSTIHAVKKIDPINKGYEKEAFISRDLYSAARFLLSPTISSRRRASNLIALPCPTLSGNQPDGMQKESCTCVLQPY